ncbi:AsmA family protein [uncultured Pseudodesulfovibrio sp.]|uniref:AsmA family protein n=1 Tax=uncultured Pseudodesulfovibrio sp. TaxID=2035858 RepID=UPI0029C6882D|nr:AsmA family protein [uncultured Pseudodesulfovibrio sp.]
MRVAIKRLLLLLVELCVALFFGVTVALFWLSYYIDTDDFRTACTQRLGTVLERKVHLSGEFNIVVWPNLALEVTGLTIDEAPAFGAGVAAEFDTVHIMIEVLPLFSKQLEIESVVVEGLRGSVVYGETGQFNWQTIFANVDKNGGGVSSSLLDGWELSVEAVEIINAEILYYDSPTQSEYRLSGIDLRTGMVQPGEGVPFSVNSDFSWAEQGLSSALTLQGVVCVSTDGSEVTLKDASVNATVSGDFLPEGSAPGELTAYLDVDWKKRSIGLRDLQVLFFGLRAEGDLKSGNLSKGFTAEGLLTVHPFVPSELLVKHAPSLPVDKVQGLKSSAVTTFVRVSEKGVQFDELALTLDDVTVRGKLGFTGYSKPVFDFALRGNTIDLDRYLPLFVTGTPFVWDDFNLNFFKKFNGSGTLRADGLTVSGIDLSDIRLNVAAEDSKISLSVESAQHKLTALTGMMDVTIGSSSETDIPTLAVETRIHAQSPERGFALLQHPPVSVGGSGQCSISVSVSPIKCPPNERSISILRYLKGTIALSLGKGVSRYEEKTGASRTLQYSNAEVSVNVVPVDGTTETEWKSLVNAVVKTTGGKDVEMLTLMTQGPLAVGLDDGEVRSSGMAVNGHMSSSLFPKEAKRVTANGVIAFDSKNGTMELSEGFLRILETTVVGSVRVTDLLGQFKGKGNLSIPGANPKRIIYLLSGKVLNTNDREALTKAVLETQFSLDENGFVLSEFRGELDGMQITGDLRGTGFKNPMLTFALTAGEFDLDRYLPSSRKPDPLTGVSPKAEPVPLPLKFLRALRLNGKASFDAFTLAKIRATGLTGQLKADEGHIHVSNAKGQLYDGALTGDWKGNISEISLSTELALDVKDMQTGPFMADVAKRDYIRGTTSADIVLKSRGATDDDILANLAGTTTIRTTNGSFKFTGYSAKSQQISAKKSTDTVSKDVQQRELPRTPFQKAVMDFTISKGVFTVDKFQVEAPPVLQSRGEGSFSLPDNSIKLSIQNDFVVVPSVTLELVGKLTDPQVKIPTGKILHDTVYNILSIPKTSFEFLRDLF